MLILVGIRLHIQLRRASRRKQHTDGIRGHGIDLLGREQWIADIIAGRAEDIRIYTIRHGDGQVEDGIVVHTVQAEVLADGDLM